MLATRQCILLREIQDALISGNPAWLVTYQCDSRLAQHISEIALAP
jgi:hypothetical protein